MVKNAPVVVLSDDVESFLMKVISARSSSQSSVLRAGIVLLSGKGYVNKDIAELLKTDKNTVSKWRRRFVEHGLEGLLDLPKSGKPPIYREEDLLRIVEMACNPPAGRSHWSVRSLGEHVRENGIGISNAHLNRVLRSFDLKPHQCSTWMNSRDPDFKKRGRRTKAVPRPTP